MKVTRILQAAPNQNVASICEAIAFMRADIWRRYGGLKSVGMSTMDICREIAVGGAKTRGMERETYKDKNGKVRKVRIVGDGIYDGLPIDGTIRAETTKDVVNDIQMYKAAAKEKVKKAIFGRTNDKAEQKRLLIMLKSDTWMNDPFLHRQMRKHFKHGRTDVANQFIVRSDKQSDEVKDGRLVITIKVAKKFGGDIRLTTTSSGKNVSLASSNLRIITHDDRVAIHYTADKGDGRPVGIDTIGVDKGYTEAFVDSDGKTHGIGFGKVMTDYSNATLKTGKNRNKLHALEKKHRAAGNVAKADRIQDNNLGRKKIDARKASAQETLRGIAFKSAHSIFDKAAVVVSEDLTSPIANKQPWKAFNRRMSSWAKGTLADALDSVCKQREADHVLVNGAYTSQMDSTTGWLQGKRSGDKFYRINGDVLHADYNAALNVRNRLLDTEITRYMPYKEVKQVLLSRSPAELTVNRHELEADACQPCADKSNG